MYSVLVTFQIEGHMKGYNSPKFDIIYIFYIFSNYTIFNNPLVFRGFSHPLGVKYVKWTFCKVIRKLPFQLILNQQNQGLTTTFLLTLHRPIWGTLTGSSDMGNSDTSITVTVKYSNLTSKIET